MGIEGVDIATQATEGTGALLRNPLLCHRKGASPVFSVVAGIINYLHINSAQRPRIPHFSP